MTLEEKFKILQDEYTHLMGQYQMMQADKESVLDKIRVEIETWHKEGTNWSDIRLIEIENIIDKYKKSEEWINFADDLIPIIDKAESEKT